MTSPAPRAAQDPLETIGGTPSVRLKPQADGGAGVHLKLEQLNPTGSAADRIAVALLDRALREGRLGPGGPVVEASLGNTGIALAQACAVRGHPLTVCMPESMSHERQATLRAWGVRLELTDGDRHLDGAHERARQIGGGLPGALVMPQWNVEHAAQAHQESTGEELVRAIEEDGGGIAAFVAAVGTGGTLLGVGRALRARFPGVRVVAALPAKEGPHRLQGLASREEALRLAKQGADQLEPVEEAEALRVRDAVAREEGLLLGLSSGAVISVARRLATTLPPDARVWAIAWDSGERYFSLAGRIR